MILPDKYTTLTESYIGLSALILDVLENRKITIDILWEIFSKKYLKKNRLKTVPTYQKFLYVVEFMYMANMIIYDDGGAISNENITANN